MEGGQVHKKWVDTFSGDVWRSPEALERRAQAAIPLSFCFAPGIEAELIAHHIVDEIVLVDATCANSASSTNFATEHLPAESCNGASAIYVSSYCDMCSHTAICAMYACYYLI